MTIEERYNAEYARLQEELAHVLEEWDNACIQVEMAPPSKVRAAKMKATKLSNKVKSLQEKVNEFLSMDLDEIDRRFS